MLQELDVAYIEKQPGPRPATAFTPAATLPAHPTALGRALLAFSPARTVEMTIMRGLRPYTAHTITSPDRFRRALAVTRLTRVAVTRWELEAGVCGVAMPVFGPGGEVVAAIELAVHDLGHELQPVMAALPSPPAACPANWRAASARHRQPCPAQAAPVGSPRWLPATERHPRPQLDPAAPTRGQVQDVAAGPVAEHRVLLAAHRRRVLQRSGAVRGPDRPVLPPGTLATLRGAIRHSAPVAGSESLSLTMCQAFGPGGLTMPAMCPPLPSTNRTGPLTPGRRSCRPTPTARCDR